MTVSVGTEVDRAAWPYRMKDLVDLTGLPRQVIHFYLQQGLLPEGHKTGRNMAYYRDEHVARIKLIRELQHERFLPLKAIKAIFEEREQAFTPVQRKLLQDVKPRLDRALGNARGERPRVDAAEVCARAGVSAQDLAQLVEVGVLGASTDAAGRTLIAQDDAWMVDLWGELRAAGFTPELGFSPQDLRIFEEAIALLFKRETELVTTRLAQLGPERVATMVERALPMINTFLSRYHVTTVRNFFAAM